MRRLPLCDDHKAHDDRTDSETYSGNAGPILGADLRVPAQGVHLGLAVWSALCAAVVLSTDLSDILLCLHPGSRCPLSRKI